MTPDELQFGRAEYSTPPPSGAACVGCKRAITSTYYQVDGKIICEACYHHLKQAEAGGSDAGRVLRAFLFGLGAAILGAVVYFAVTVVTHMEFGILAILVGFAVGFAVRKGSGGRGGQPYQLMAVVLTYLAIVSIYAPHLLKILDRQGPLVFLVLLCAVPWLAGVRNIIGWFIIGFGLYQAWRMNKRIPLNLSGPFSLASRPPSTTGAS